MLAQMEAQVRLAKEALADEREHDFTGAVILLELDACALGNLVRGW